MNLITTTQLRTKTKRLVEALLGGESIKVIHRSKIIGTFNPEPVGQEKIFSAQKFFEIAKKLNFAHLTEKERERRYREAMEKKHGKNIS